MHEFVYVRQFCTCVYFSSEIDFHFFHVTFLYYNMNEPKHIIYAVISKY